jgi:hypothetical protein
MERLGALGRWMVCVPSGSDRWALTRFVLLRLLGFVYFMAFLSLVNQFGPLLGSHGLLPASHFLARMHSKYGSAAVLRFLSIFWAGSSDGFMLSMAWAGVALSLAVIAGFANSIVMVVLWALYLSFVNVGQEWYGFGWESQLLETGFLAVFLCPLLDARPFPGRPAPFQVVWLLRWLAFRIFLGAGLIKMRGDASWRDLTALYFHYETQPIPNPLSPWLHFMPHWFHNLGCLWNHAVELVVPFFVFWPPRLRRIAGVLLVSFQGLLILSGNLSFLNWLTIVPCLACLDDGVWRRFLPRRWVAAADRSLEGAALTRPQTAVAWSLVAVVSVLSLAPVSNLLSPDQKMNYSFTSLHLVNTYGAFGYVGKERNEIILEGTDDAVVTRETRWRVYEFKAKPGDPDRGLPIVSPYHHRLDWEIWFAAMESPNEHPWLVHFIWKLLENDEGALSLLANRPFPSAPPKFIRAELYRYRFAPPGSPATWIRERIRSWLPPLSAKDEGFRRFIRDSGWLEP